jgi:hypothetical protein
MFGDIITDLGAMIQGGMGIAAGGNINPQGTSMFEPIGGSAPKYTGQGVINPLAAICAGQMMLDFLGEKSRGGKDGLQHIATRGPGGGGPLRQAGGGPLPLAERGTGARPVGRLFLRAGNPARAGLGHRGIG